MMHWKRYLNKGRDENLNVYPELSFGRHDFVLWGVKYDIKPHESQLKVLLT